MQIAGADFNPVVYTMAVLYPGMGRESEEKGEHWHGQRERLNPCSPVLWIKCSLFITSWVWGLRIKWSLTSAGSTLGLSWEAPGALGPRQKERRGCLLWTHPPFL